jgi:hypothetical protein
MSGLLSFQHVREFQLKYLFYHLLKIISTLLYTHFTVSCEIMLRIQHKGSTKLMYNSRQDAQWYCLIQSIAIDYGRRVVNYMYIPNRPTAIYITRTILNTSTCSSRKFAQMSPAMSCQTQIKILRSKIFLNLFLCCSNFFYVVLFISELFYLFLCCSMYFFLCGSVYCLCVNVYCTTATGWQPNCS